jgi:DNA-directed RNA polymerase subunit M/transcription elongation factor TFIIS
MHFCAVCRNMYYLKLTDGGEGLTHYCRHCGHEDPNLTAKDACVSTTQFKRSEQKYAHAVNQYTKLDPTLPRTRLIRCPTQACPSNAPPSEDGASAPDREVLYIRYDDVSMKYLYMCVHCDTMWTTDEQV